MAGLGNGVVGDSDHLDRRFGVIEINHRTHHRQALNVHPFFVHLLKTPLQRPHRGLREQPGLQVPPPERIALRTGRDELNRPFKIRT